MKPELLKAEGPSLTLFRRAGTLADRDSLRPWMIACWGFSFFPPSFFLAEVADPLLGLRPSG